MHRSPWVRSLRVIVLGSTFIVAGGLAGPGPAAALPGFYVGSADAPPRSDATMVVLMRDGRRTVVSMQPGYIGPAKDFVIVVPVPAIIKEQDVKTLPRELFDRIDGLTAPRLVETWEQDPCVLDEPAAPPAAADASAVVEPDPPAPAVEVAARFTAGEYQIVTLAAKQPSALADWLRDNGLVLPSGADEALRPYIEQGMKFFVARVDASALELDERGRATLSPLRFHYDSDTLELPLRPGLLSSAGAQDTVIHILARERHVAANVANATIPTNLEVKDTAHGSFAPFYVALFDATREHNPGAVITEYAWPANSCEPCPQRPLDLADLMTLGVDVLPGLGVRPEKRGAQWTVPDAFVLTRLHVRHDRGEKIEDLVFKPAGPIVGGRELAVAGQLERGAQPTSELNAFQARYVVRHRWTGRVDCKEPHPGRWGGPPADWKGEVREAIVARDLAAVPRDASLAGYVAHDIPEIRYVVRADEPPARKPAIPAANPAPAPDVEVVLPGEPVASTRTSCGCTGGEAPAGWLGLLALLAIRRRRP
ncbi:MAG TPA: DUF2330 domain-containing protein [Nannocystis sp.]